MSKIAEILDVEFTPENLNEISKKFLIGQFRKNKDTLSLQIQKYFWKQKRTTYSWNQKKSDLNIPDGTGILWAAKYLNLIKPADSKISRFYKWITSLLKIPFYPQSIRTVLKERITGVDLMHKICELSKKNNLRIFLLGAREGIAEKTRKALEEKFPGIIFVGTFAGTPNQNEETEIVQKINNSNANILFVAYGAPAQEIWISRNLPKLPKIRIAMGVGGAFDFISGTRKRAPKWIQRLGLEWLFRLIQEPKRIKRIYNATIKFPLQILKHVNLQDQKD